MNLRLRLYLASIYLAFAMILLLSWNQIEYSQIIIMTGFVFLTYIFNMEVVKDLQTKLSYLIIIPFVIPALIYLTPEYAMLYLFISVMLINHKLIWYKRLFNATSISISLYLSSLFFHSLYPIFDNVTTIYSGSFFITVVFSTIIFTFVSDITLYTVISLEKGKFDINAFIGITSSSKTVLLTFFLGLINVILFHYTNLVGMAIFTFMIYFIKPALQYRQIFDNELSTYTNFVLHILKKMDPVTHTHSERVKFWTVLLAEKMELPKSEIRQLSQAASWHDIGKIEIPIDIINKPNKLTSLEYDIMKSHSEKGYQLVKDMHFFKKFLPVIRHHHERVDGKGYPLGLSGEDIPLHARIMSITDAFDAMTSDRSYRNGMSLHDAVNELIKHAGVQFDRELVEIFVKALKEEYGEQYERYSKDILKNVI